MQFIIIFYSCFLLDIISERGIIWIQKSCVSQRNRKNINCSKEVRMSENIALTVEEAADFTGIGRNTLRQLISWKTMPTIKVGRKVLIRTQDLDRFLELNRNTDLRNQAEVIPLTGYVN